MAFPTSLPAPGTTAGFSQLDGPPPSPAMETGMSPGPSMPPGGLGSLVGGGMPVSSGMMPPEVLTGILQAGETMIGTIDSFAQVAPDLAPDFAVAKQALMAALAKVMQAGGGPTSPNAAGPGFPGGGFDQGAMPLASGGM
jgi:hypothetical protein